MKEQIISKFRAAKLVQKYYTFHYYDLVDVKTKIRMKGNKMFLDVKMISIVNHKKIVESITIDEAEILSTICDYMDVHCCKVHNINFEPNFHNVNIKYEGDFDFDIKKLPKPLIKLRRVF